MNLCNRGNSTILSHVLMTDVELPRLHTASGRREPRFEVGSPTHRRAELY